jgi:hypothetical protein
LVYRAARESCKAVTRLSQQGQQAGGAACMSEPSVLFCPKEPLVRRLL